ncbi:unnamed protein product [Rotaria sp. Silwood1]|nr:unnamed protein product [Rotaria sp. Silwood1]CAF1689544.1 unnamed protein product [Rotaria sp. Silwood1]
MDINVTELESEFKKVLLQLANDPFNRELLHELQVIQNGSNLQAPYSATNITQSTTNGHEASSSPRLAINYAPRTPIVENNKNMKVNVNNNNNMTSNVQNNDNMTSDYKARVDQPQSSNIQPQSDSYARSSK